MPLRQKLLPTFQGVAAGQTATCPLTLLQRVHAQWLEIGDNGAASNGNANNLAATLDNLLDVVNVKVNGKIQRQFVGSECHKLNLINGAEFGAKTSGVAGTAGYRVYLPIWYAEPWRKNPAEVALPAWNLQGIDSASLEVKPKAGLVNPVLTGFYEYDSPTGNIGAIVKWLRESLGAVGTKQDFNQISKRDFIQSINLFPTTDGHFVQNLKFTANGAEVIDLTTTLENQAKLLGRGLNPDTSATPRFDLIFDYDDPVNGALNANGLSEMTLHVEYDAAANGTMITMVQQVGPPD
jgi:hypothetical protein